VHYSPNIFIVLFHFDDHNYLFVQVRGVWAFKKCNRYVLIVIVTAEMDSIAYYQLWSIEKPPYSELFSLWDHKVLLLIVQ
jgi:hypothetical protein